MKEFNKISSKDFWEKYSADAIHFSQHPELPLTLNLSVFFDVYFGKLARHYFIIANKNEILLNCKSCVHISNIKPEVCSAHIGVINGQINELFQSKMDLISSIKENICTIRKA